MTLTFYFSRCIHSILSVVLLNYEIVDYYYYYYYYDNNNILWATRSTPYFPPISSSSSSITILHKPAPHSRPLPLHLHYDIVFTGFDVYHSTLAINYLRGTCSIVTVPSKKMPGDIPGAPRVFLVSNSDPSTFRVFMQHKNSPILTRNRPSPLKILNNSIKFYLFLFSSSPQSQIP